MAAGRPSLLQLSLRVMRVCLCIVLLGINEKLQTDFDLVSKNLPSMKQGPIPPTSSDISLWNNAAQCTTTMIYLRRWSTTECSRWMGLTTIRSTVDTGCSSTKISFLLKNTKHVDMYACARAHQDNVATGPSSPDFRPYLARRQVYHVQQHNTPIHKGTISCALQLHPPLSSCLCSGCVPSHPLHLWRTLTQEQSKREHTICTGQGLESVFCMQTCCRLLCQLSLAEYFGTATSFSVIPSALRARSNEFAGICEELSRRHAHVTDF